MTNINPLKMAYKSYNNFKSNFTSLNKIQQSSIALAAISAIVGITLVLTGKFYPIIAHNLSYIPAIGGISSATSLFFGIMLEKYKKRKKTPFFLKEF